MTFIASPQQQDVIDFGAHKTGSALVVAVAGAGKTTTIMQTVSKVRGSSAILAFNKKIADELKAKLKKAGIPWKQAEAGTVHSFGFRALKKMFPVLADDTKNPIRGHKIGDLCAKMIEDGEITPTLAPHSAVICELVSLGKQRAIGAVYPIENTKAWIDIIDHFDLLDAQAQHLALGIVDAAQRLLKKSNAVTDVIDFDDMVYLPLVVEGCPFWQYENIFVDEAQDTNAARRELVKRLLKPGGRVFAVGDPCQAIYGFTGADADSLDLIRKEFDCVELPLTVTYRCPKAIVRFAQNFVNHIQAHESAPEGSIGLSTFEDMMRRSDLNQDSAILCRNTKPLVKAAFAMIRNRIPCKIEGRDVGNGLKTLATKWPSAKTINALEERLELWRAKEIAKAHANKKETQVQQIEDKVDTLKVIFERVREDGKHSVADVVAHIDQLFGDNVTGMITLSTIHKSKGREWKRVFWLDRIGTCPSPYAKQAWERVQEVNLQYVAATRAMEQLIDLLPPVEAVMPKPANENKKPEPKDDGLDIPAFLRRTA